MQLKILNWLELIPILITFFMLMTSLINQDIKGLIWLAYTICPFLFITWLYRGSPDNCPDSILPLFSKGQSFSVSSFFIIFTLFYLLLPMLRLKNINYYVLFSFVLFYLTDIATKQRLCPELNIIAIFTGTLIGAIYGTGCFFLLTTAGDKFLYFSTSESNNVYCSKPKNQTFKCNVYKNGQIISTL
jgi:hypothetical protein